MERVELLAPARDLRCGLVAIDCGADAVYLGAPRFGARQKVGNTLEDIAALVAHAHTYWARVYVTVNTLLHDDELHQAVRLIHELYELGVDAAIIQDVGLLESDLPPMALIASTQMHNHTPERVAFLEAVGFRRAILARELSLEQIRAIRAHTSLELECFVHGALCTGYSGQCYLSYAIGGRSGNRGECAQPCRRKYSLVDADGRVLMPARHLLSLRDLALDAELGALLDAGVTSFKIEGRLKDEGYVANVVAWYRRELDRALADRGWARSSSGQGRPAFEADLSKTFNRGYTTYLLHGRGEPPGALDSPKMVGEPLGSVLSVEGASFVLETTVQLHPGDGLCWFGTDGDLEGTVVNAVSAPRAAPSTSARRLLVTAERMAGIRPGLPLYRNHDHAFLRQVTAGLKAASSQPARQIAVRLRLETTAGGLRLQAVDEDGNSAEAWLPINAEPAEKPRQAEATAHKQLCRTGDTPFACAGVELAWDRPCFVPVAALNALRREALERLLAVRAANRPAWRGEVRRNDTPYPETQLSYLGNALNRQAVTFYRRHGVLEVEPAAESGLDMRGRVVMRTRYCLAHQLGYCGGDRRRRPLREPLALVDEDGRRYGLRFDCRACEMEVVFVPGPA